MPSKPIPPPYPLPHSTDLNLTQTKAKDVAGGTPAVISAMKITHQESGIIRGNKALLKLNQKDGFDCPSCAWPDPDHKRSRFEYCENGAKALAWETTKKRVTRALFAQYTIPDLLEKSDHWLEKQGRLTEPMIHLEGTNHYTPISWDDAFAHIAKHLNQLETPDEAIFYTSGRASNEAAFLYQLFVRSFGTNNLPDCSNMCHESSGSALTHTIGIGKGTVSLDDIHQAEAIFILGQNPGTNHPRMLSALQKAARNGCEIIVFNPLKEAGLIAFSHPQNVSGLLGGKTTLATQYHQIKINGDHAALLGLNKAILEAEGHHPGQILDHEFIQNKTTGITDLKAHLNTVHWDTIEKASGLTRKAIEQAAAVAIKSKKTIACWAMGLTQHHNAVETIQEVVNFLLLRGNLGKPGAGLCPVRGHSNVQGDRTMGIYEKPDQRFLDSLDAVFKIQAPRKHGYDTVQAIEAMIEQKAKVFIALGGNFLSATPDTEATAEGLRNCNLSVQISTKLNRSHLITGKDALILPCLGRTEIDRQNGHQQFITMENSMGIVHSSTGQLTPASPHLRSEPAIICGLAQATLGPNHPIPWNSFLNDYDQVRESIARVIPHCQDYNKRVQQPGGFYIYNTAKDLNFESIGGYAKITVNHLHLLELKKEELLLMTIRSHDQFNTTIYGLDDRYRGIKGERRVLFLNPGDMAARGIKAEQPVDITSHFKGQQRKAPLFLALPYSIPRGCAAAYFPETNVLVPLQSTARISNTPTSKSIIITIEAHQPERASKKIQNAPKQIKSVE